MNRGRIIKIRSPNMETYTTIPQGSFALLNSAFKANQGKFLIRQRKQPTPNKPENYLIYLGGKKRFEYISSLYEEESTPSMTVFRFDYREEIYLLTLEPGKVEIEVISL